MEGTFLAVVDADGIQDYIFAPRQLKLIRGASAIQRDLNLSYVPQLLGVNADEVLKRRLAEGPGQGWEVVYAGGGNVYALFRDKCKAETFVKDACQLYRKRGGQASATGAVCKWRERFRTTLEDTQAEVAMRKSSASMPKAGFSGPYWKSCEACGMAPASDWTRNPVTGERILCATCGARRTASERSPLFERVKEKLGALKPPDDLEGIAAVARPLNYLGFVYLDVDKLGKHFSKIDETADYRKHSSAIKKAVEDGVVEGCAAAVEAVPKGSVAPFEIFLVGGDDAIVMLAAQAVFPFLQRFSEVFEQELEGFGLTFSTGVVWAHHHLPIAQYAHHAKELLRSAKAEGGNRIDYLVASESMVEKRRGGQTCRPYPLAEFNRLTDTIAAWKKCGFPSSKAHQLYGMAFEPPMQGELDFLYWLSRLEKKQREAACGFFNGRFWQEDPRQTPGADLAELWDFVEAG